MPWFDVLAYAADGAPVRGRRRAASVAALWDELAAERLEVERLRRVWWAVEWRPRRRVAPRQVETFTRLLAALLRSLTTVQALEVLEEQMPAGRLGEVVRALRTEVRRGMPLHCAMRRHVDVFGATYCAVVEQGERTGTLDQMLGHLAYMLEHTGRVRAEFWKAMSYPLIVLGTVLLMAVYVLTTVLPEFAEIYRHHQLELPRLTVALLGASALLAGHAVPAALGLAGLALAGSRLLRREAVRERVDGLLLRVPVVGRLVQGAAMAGFCHYLSVSLAGGVVVVQALRLAAETVDNRVLARALRGAAQEMGAGRGLAVALQRSARVPQLVVSIAAVGERSGDLPEMLRHTARTCEEEVLRDVQLFVRATEPLMILLLTGVVGVLVGAIYSPVIKAFSAFGG